MRMEEDASHWPDKMREIHGLLTHGKEWGEHWAACVREWVQLEGMDGFPVDVKSNTNIGAFSSATHPEPVGRWIAYKRMAKDRPIGNLKTYAAAWWTWWGDCQPSDRSVDQNGRPADPDDALDWSCMDVTTSCGILLVIVSLSFWGAEVFKAGGTDSRQAQEWQDAVSQATVAFTCIRRWKEANEGGSGKRKSIPPPSSSSRPKKCRKA
ncbi:hypothetical protein EWM64_g4746 [Hericium alpestre]|uniref:Uncharacterized protein n=1 Tax=Hericium alpestre TaxID=135208 RepID=A0A4Z0A0P7_9AGAM|nr:hypothetical protein EWM64_g4746 [Hericium alpestre]